MKTTFIFLSLFVGVLAAAKPLYYNQLISQFPGNQLKNTMIKCQTCHGRTSLLNAFGKDFALKVKTMSPYDFHKIEGLDSDGDGVSNFDEIMKGTNPGVREGGN